MNMNRSDNSQGTPSLRRWSVISIVVTLAFLGHDAVMAADVHGVGDPVHRSHQHESATVFDEPAESTMALSGLQVYRPLHDCGTFRIAVTLAQSKVNLSFWNYTTTFWPASSAVIKNAPAPPSSDGFATSPQVLRALFQVFLI